MNKFAVTFVLCHMRRDVLIAFIVELIVKVKILHRAKYKPDLLSTFPRDITDPGLFLVNLSIYSAFATTTQQGTDFTTSTISTTSNMVLEAIYVVRHGVSLSLIYPRDIERLCCKSNRVFPTNRRHGSVVECSRGRSWWLDNTSKT
jgi:hypothetical protein